MIICHTRKLIFIKTKKVGGTSFEIALSAFCGPDCVITPISPEDEATRTALGWRGPQNHVGARWPGLAIETPGRFYNHMPAPDVKALVPPAIWQDYAKVTFVRDPFDAAISRYWWEGGEARLGLAFDAFLARFPQVLEENATIAPLAGEARLDHYLRYEAIGAELAAIGLDDVAMVFAKLRAKGNRRPRHDTSVAQVYARHPAAAALVARHCAAEIAHFGYALPAGFDQPQRGAA